nr:uncharacterized protein LOC111512882 [Leptinotarsa decemlineata]
MVTIIYAIIGMPLFLLYLSNIGDIMARSFKFIYANCCLCRCCPKVAKRRAIRKLRREQNLSTDNDSSLETENSSVVISIPSFGPRDSEASNDLTTEDDEYDVQNVTVPVTICLSIMVG